MRKLFVALLAVCSIMAAQAVDVKIEGLNYHLEDGLATVLPTTGAPYAGDIALAASVTYKGRTYAVAAIADYAFNHSAITAVTIPASVEKMGACAFMGCDHLGSVTISGNFPGGYGKQVFADCPLLKTAVVLEGVTELSESAFEYCEALINVSLPSTLTTIGKSAFHGCSMLKAITIPESVTSIGGWAFDGCSSLAKIVIPNGVSKINKSTFAYCTSLTEVVIPEGVTSIGAFAFNCCRALKKVSIAQTVQQIGASAFGSTNLARVTITNSAAKVDSKAFPLFCKIVRK